MTDIMIYGIRVFCLKLQIKDVQTNRMKNTGTGFDTDFIGKHPLYQKMVCLGGIPAYEQFECITCS